MRIFSLVIFLTAACNDQAYHPVKDAVTPSGPAIEVTPSSLSWDFIEPIGEYTSSVVEFVSVGEENLEVTNISLEAGDSAFILTDTVLLGSFPNGTGSSIVVNYVADGESAIGALQIVSNDPENPIYHVPLYADGEIAVDTDEPEDSVPPLAQPIAVCSASPTETEAIHGSASWIGDTSYDPDGIIAEYRWALVSSPAGATATMPSGGANRRRFVPDVAGDYIAELVVVDNDGIESEPCQATLTATAGDGLWIEIFWTESGDDMDLHLLDDGGVLTANSDCYYGNCTYGFLDWGVRGDPIDDPILDLDDIPGVGPENINIDSPAPGTYTIYVHDYPGSVYNGRNNVTANIYWGGTLVWTDTRNINSEGCYEPFAEVDVPGGIVTSVAGTCR